MQNLVRMILNPRRGGSVSIGFRRMCIRIYDWPTSEVEVWKSLDDGIVWEKVDEDQYRSSFDSASRDLYVSFLFDFTQTIQLAFFDINGQAVGIGYTFEKYGVTHVGWEVESEIHANDAVGWSCGALDVSEAPLGFDIEGPRGANIPGGFMIKYPTMANCGVGHNVAQPTDGMIRIGFPIGLEFSKSIQAGATVMGLAELPSGLVCLDTADLEAMSMEAAVRRQKTCTLTGTAPEELD